MTRFKKVAVSIAVIIALVSVSGCKSADPGLVYEKESAAGTGYGAGIKSDLYIEDLYFISVGTQRSLIERSLGMPHYTEEGNSLYNVYDLNNGDSVEFTYDPQKGTVSYARYNYADGTTDDLFSILTDKGVIKSPNSQNNGGEDQNNNSDDKPNDNTGGSEKPENDNKRPTQTAVQGDVFASGTYNYELISPYISYGAARSAIISDIGKPSYYFSRNFTEDSYIVDCYTLDDGGKLYLDYGYTRDTLRCAAIQKGGTFTPIAGMQWSIADKPSGFTRKTANKTAVGRLKSNMTPAAVYKVLGEPSWYEGTQGSYTDVFALPGGEYAYLNFGSAHNKLTSASIKGADGAITVVILNS